ALTLHSLPQWPSCVLRCATYARRNAPGTLRKWIIAVDVPKLAGLVRRNVARSLACTRAFTEVGSPDRHRRTDRLVQSLRAWVRRSRIFRLPRWSVSHAHA